MVLDDGKLHGGITRDGNFEMCVRCSVRELVSLTSHVVQTCRQERTCSQCFLMISTLIRCAVCFQYMQMHRADSLQLRVDVFETESLPEVRPYIPGTSLSPPSTVTLPYPILLTPRHKNDYFVERQSFNLMGMFQSPMMLMMLVMGGMMLAMPYIMVRTLLGLSYAFV